MRIFNFLIYSNLFLFLCVAKFSYEVDGENAPEEGNPVHAGPIAIGDVD